MQYTEEAPAVTIHDATSHSRSTAGAGAEPQRIRIEQHSFSGMLWLIGWLFTIGFLQLPLIRAVLAMVVWPYYLGTTLRSLLP
jgi:hypothetical protein